jgi:hypothetical protein
MDIESRIDMVSTYADLANLLTEVMYKWYPDGDYIGWLRWSDKYATMDTAKRAALHMYDRLYDGIEEPEPNVSVPTVERETHSLRRFVIQ